MSSLYAVQRRWRGFAGLLLTAATGLVYGQAKPARLVRLPAPLWSDEAPERSRVTGETVFFDLARNQAVFLITEPSGALREARYDLPGAIEPSVWFTVKPGAEGVLDYSYVISDSGRSRQRTRSMKLLLPGQDVDMLPHNSAWPVRHEDAAVPDGNTKVPFGTMRWIVWEDHGSSDAKVFGLSTGLSSKYLPGFTNATFEGKSEKPLTREIVVSLPTEAAAKAARFLEPGFGGRTVLVAAPIFRPDTPKQAIAANLHYGISSLRNQGQIAKDSAWAREALKSLSTFIESGGIAAFPAGTARPSGALEAEIANIVAIALR
jgi:hypothetical protein